MSALVFCVKVRLAARTDQDSDDAPRRCDPGGTAGTVDGEGRRMAGGHVAAQLRERAHRAPRRRPARGPVAETPDDPRDPFAVEVFARDDDDAAAAPESGRGEDAPV